MFMPGTLIIAAECPDRVGSSPIDVTEKRSLDLIVDPGTEECRVEVLLDKRPLCRCIEKAAPASRRSVTTFESGWLQVKEAMRGFPRRAEPFLIPLRDIVVLPGY